MTRMVIPVVLLCSAFVVACDAETPASPDGVESVAFSVGSPVSSATGGGKIVYNADYWETNAFSARKRADGSAEGTVVAHWGAQDFRATVHCLEVAGNSAWIGMTVTQTSDPTWIPEGMKFRVNLRDNGNSGEDQVSYFYWNYQNTADCLTPIPNPFLVTLTDGNITVR